VLRTWVAAPPGLHMSWDRMKAVPAVDRDTASISLLDLCVSAGPTLYAVALGCRCSRQQMADASPACITALHLDLGHTPE
jgi:hypothetical protein